MAAFAYHFAAPWLFAYPCFIAYFAQYLNHLSI